MEEKEFEKEVAVMGPGPLATIAKAEIDMQISTAHAYPRSIKAFRSEALDMVTLNEQVAEECIYALPRDGKTIEGPSARFAEVMVSAWGNSRAGARVVAEDGMFITAQGVFHDLQRNVAINYEVRRRITDRNGRTYKPDMIGVTANAACSIALRNAILKGIPKAFWSEMYEAARKVVKGDVTTLANRRADAMGYLQKFGVTPEMACAVLKVPGVEDIGLDELVTLKALITAVKEGDTTVEQAFPDPSKVDQSAKGGVGGLKSELMPGAPVPNSVQGAALGPAPASQTVFEKIIAICSKLPGYAFDDSKLRNTSESTLEDIYTEVNAGNFGWLLKSKILVEKGK